MMMLAMVVTTTMPAASHASMKHSENATSQTAAAQDAHDCDHHGEKASHDKQSQNEKPCCDKGVCKCVGGTCHSLSKIFGNSSNVLLASTVSKSEFSFANEFVDSALPERLKRPPKA